MLPTAGQHTAPQSPAAQLSGRRGSCLQLWAPRTASVPHGHVFLWFLICPSACGLARAHESWMCVCVSLPIVLESLQAISRGLSVCSVLGRLQAPHDACLLLSTGSCEPLPSGECRGVGLVQGGPWAWPPTLPNRWRGWLCPRCLGGCVSPDAPISAQIPDKGRLSPAVSSL